MPTPGERKALIFLSGMFLLGAAVRAHRTLREHPEPDAASRLALRRQLAAVDSLRAAPPKPKGRRARPARSAIETPATVSVASLAPSPQPRAIDLDVASAAEIERLPRIGPTLAARIVGNRDSLGPFGSLQELQRVRGVGPAMAKTLAPHVTFSLAPRQQRVTEGGYVASTPARTARRRSRSANPP